METKKIILILAAIIIGTVILVSARNISQGTSSINTANQNSLVQAIGNQNSAEIATVVNGIQNVRLIVDNKGDYVLQPSTLLKGVPVKMEVDLSTVIGCARSIVIPSFNVIKNVRTGDNIIEFTPDKTGTFSIHCSMNMYIGSFSVVDGAGKKSDYVETLPEKEVGTCGISVGGGCGCGGRF